MPESLATASQFSESFATRHIGPDDADIQSMLQTMGKASVAELIDQTVPSGIRMGNLEIASEMSETAFIRMAREVSLQNQVWRTCIGKGYYSCTVPPVIQRNVLENPGWYTQYTPYQAEIAQGRLEALLNYQTMVLDLTGMEITNASLLDEATAAAEAMSMQFGLRSDDHANIYWASSRCHPQTLAVLKTRSEPMGIDLQVGEISASAPKGTFGALIQYPDTHGQVEDFGSLIATLKTQGISVAMATDLLALILLKSPGELGADIAFGSAQRFGVPMGFGGPHAGFLATVEAFKRHIPGRIIGVSIDRNGKRALRMALQTREQHIRREKATSNICTAQVLLAVMSGFYAVYHGQKGLTKIARRVHALTRLLDAALAELGCTPALGPKAAYFDTLLVRLPQNTASLASLRAQAEKSKVNFHYGTDDSIGISVDETWTRETVAEIVAVFATALNSKTPDSPAVDRLAQNLVENLPGALLRQSPFLTHPVFNSHHSEHEMLRYIRSLEKKDLSLTTSMIPLGSCTMKLNATTEMVPISWPEMANLHPFIPKEQAQGYYRIFTELEKDLSTITGLPGTSLQPNAGSQGEYTGLLVIRAYHLSRNQGSRNICLIPSSAHGTNPASAAMVGLKVVVSRCDARGNIDLEDFRRLAQEHKDRLACAMITYPSTHGVFESGIREACKIVHEVGGQVYMDGANLNAQVGLTSPGFIGADVCHINLHKTFCIPHGGGGPGMGPICVAAHLKAFLPGHPMVKTGGEHAISAVSAAPFGSSSILAISWAYIRMMGGVQLKKATEIAIFNANYLKSVLAPHYPVLYQGENGTVAHEMILDCRGFKETSGVEVEDIAKRLIDFGFHAPTVSFPVAGTLMIEPTESESKAELDRFCEAMITIRGEIRDIESGKSDRLDNVLKMAPHTAEEVVSDAWTHAYSRELAAFPLPWVRRNKFWPSVGRLNNTYGDKNLFCSCPPIEV